MNHLNSYLKTHHGHVLLQRYLILTNIVHHFLHLNIDFLFHTWCVFYKYSRKNEFQNLKRGRKPEVLA